MLFFLGQNIDKLSAGCLSKLRNTFRLQLLPVDYRNPKTVLHTINSWALENTECRINKLLNAPPTHNGNTIFTAGILYLWAHWHYCFLKKNTHMGKFNTYNGKVDVEYMLRDDDRLDVYEDAHGWYLRIGYSDLLYSMIIYLPKDEYALTNQRLANTLNNIHLSRAVSRFEIKSGSLILPKFVYSACYDLKPILHNCGLDYLFRRAHFSQISEDINQLENFFHYTNYSASDDMFDDEETIETSCSGRPSTVKDLRVNKLFINRPFLYFFTDFKTGYPFLIGKMMSPEITTLQ